MLDYIRNHFHPLWRLRQNRLFRALQERLDPDFTCRIEGISASVKLLRDASIIFPHKGKEEGSRREFRRILKEFEIQLFFDIGANIGLYSWTALANGVTEIFLVEADSTNQRLLAKTIRRNKLKRCFLVPFAMSSEVGTAEFLVDRASGATGSLEDHTENTSSLHFAYGMKESCFVPTLTLDVFTEYASRRKTMLKIDVEGAEERMIAGGKSFLQTVYPFILIECFDRSRLVFFEQLGYTVSELPENCNYLLSPPDNRIELTSLSLRSTS